MPYSYPNRIALATSSVPTPVGFAEAAVTYPNVTGFTAPLSLSSYRPPYSDSGLIAARTRTYFNGSFVDVEQPRAMTLLGLQVASNITNAYTSGILPAANLSTEDIRDYGYFNEAYQFPFHENPSFYLNVQFANCYYRPWGTGSFESAGTLVNPIPARVASGIDVMGSMLGAPHSYQYQPIFRGPGATQSAIRPFRRTENGGTDIDGTAYRMLGVWGRSSGTASVQFVNLFEFGDTHTDVQCNIIASTASASSGQVSTLGTLVYDVLGVTTTESYLAIYTPGKLYNVVGDPTAGGTATLNAPVSTMYTPQLKNLNGTGNKDISQFVWTGFPGGFYARDGSDNSSLYIVNAGWTEYTQYNIVENDQVTCDALAAGGLNVTRTSDNKWILYGGIGDEPNFVQLVEGPAAPGWTGCPGNPVAPIAIPPAPTVITGDVIIRAWPLSLDGHDMYVLRLGLTETLVYDKSTKQWYSWNSTGNAVWAVNSGFEWLGGVGTGETNMVVGDDTTGTLYFLNPEQPYDEPSDAGAPVQERYFTRIVMGRVPVTGRDFLPCYAIFVTADMGDPAYTGAGVTLYTSDDVGQTWTSHGKIGVVDGVFYPELVWTSLGQMGAPGRLFVLIDDGAVTRIDSMEMQNEF